MNIFKKILQFIGGKPPDIFDADGNVRHNFSKKEWENWNKRYSSEEENRDWKTHKGTESGLDRNKNNQSGSGSKN